ncbi:MAG: tetratricopeptide repeat protein [Bryobacteraceae bacterium]
MITDAGAPTAEKMAHRVEQMRALLGGSTKFLPLRVVLLGSSPLFAALRPSATVGGFYQSSAEEDWIVVQWGRPDSERAMSHEIVHAFMEHSGPRRPLWMEEGLAEFYSTALLEHKSATTGRGPQPTRNSRPNPAATESVLREFLSNSWTIGRPIAMHVRALNQRAWLGEREFFEAGPDSVLREEDSRGSRFYAQSWAVVHYLLTTPGVREKTPALFTALSEGVPFARACEAVLGQRQGMLLEAARRAVEEGNFRTASVAAGPIARPAQLPVALTGEESDAILVNLSLAVGHPHLADKMARSPAQRGLLALSRGNRGEAERLLAEAVANGAPGAAPHFELAMLIREEKREPERVAALLRQTVERNPNHAEAHFILGLNAAAAGDNEGAIDYYQKAAQILPRQANFWHALALALERTGRLAEASHAALRCRLAARNPAEREMAAAIERLIREPTVTSAVPKKPAVEVPESWRGLRGDVSAEGELVEFDCAAKPPLAHVATAAERLALRVEKPSSIRITGTDSVRHTFTCGPQKTAVRVEFHRDTNELTAIEFK